MISVLSAFIALVVLAWGLDVATLERGAASLPWFAYEQGLYLSGLLAISLMSLAMVLATRPVVLERPLGGMDRIFRLHKWAGILAAVFAALHWLIEMSDDLIKSVFGRAGRLDELEFGGLYEMLRDAGEEIGEFAVYLVLAMVVLSLWKRFPYKFWRQLHRAMPLLYLLLAFHAAVLAPPGYWTQPVGLLLAAMLAAGSVASVIALTGRIGRDRRVQGVVTAVSSPAADVTELPSVALHIHDSAAGTGLTADALGKDRAAGQRAEVWFCGPRRFGDQLKAGLRQVWGGRLRFRREAFEMR